MIVEVAFDARGNVARARWAFVGGLKEESRMNIVSSFGGRDGGLIISKDLEEDIKDSRGAEYFRSDIHEVVAVGVGRSSQIRKRESHDIYIKQNLLFTSLRVR